MTAACCPSSSHSNCNSRPVHPNKQNFIEGVDLIFDSWSAYRICVQMDFSGEETAEKAVWFRKTIVEHFDAEGKKVEPEDLEDILLDVMSREFNVHLEDSSEIDVARLLFDLFRECIRGEVGLLNQLRAKAIARKAKGDIVAQSQGVDKVEEVDLSLLDPEYLQDNYDEFSDEDMDE